MTIAERINRMIQTILESAEFTSANPTHINRLIQINTLENPDLEKDIKQLVETDNKKPFARPDSKIDEGDIRQRKEQIKIKKSLDRLKSGNVGEIADMTSTQFGNLRSFAHDPFNFVIGALGKKIPKAITKGGAIGLVLFLAEEVTKVIIKELEQPGRLLDLRFKRKIEKEFLLFRKREEKEKLRKGFSRVIVTSMPRLRGGQYQAYDSFRAISQGKPPLQNGFDTRIPIGYPGGLSKAPGVIGFGTAVVGTSS